MRRGKRRGLKIGMSLLLSVSLLVSGIIVPPASASPDLTKISDDLSRWAEELDLPANDYEEREILIADMPDPSGVEEPEEPAEESVEEPVEEPTEEPTEETKAAAPIIQNIGAVEKISIPLINQKNAENSTSPAVSEDGRFVVFDSSSSKLVAGDLNEASDIFLFDRDSSQMSMVTDIPYGAQGDSYNPVISMDGRYILFASEAYNLTDEYPEEEVSLYLYDRETDEISLAAEGMSPANNVELRTYAISADGRYAAFWSHAANGLKDDYNNNWDVFLKDLTTGWMTRITSHDLSYDGQPTNFFSALSMTPDGRFVAFETAASLVSTDTNNLEDVYVYDASTGEVERVSVSSAGEQGNGGSEAPSISADGRYVAFVSMAGNLSAGHGGPGNMDIFIHDRVSRSTEAVPRSTAETGWRSSPAISADGRYLVFGMYADSADNLYLYDRLAGSTRLLSVTTSGSAGNEQSVQPYLTAGGGYAVFSSMAMDLTSRADEQDTYFDIYLAELTPEPPAALPVWPNGAVLTADQIGASYIYLNWPDAFGGTGNPVYAITAIDSEGMKRFAVTLDSRLLMTGLDPAESYTFELVSGSTGFVFGTEKLIASAVTELVEQTPPAKVTGLTAVPANGMISVSWTDPTDPDLTSVSVGWKVAGSPEYYELPPIQAGVQHAELTGIVNNKLYDIRVIAQDAEGNQSEVVTQLVRSGEGRIVSRISMSPAGMQMLPPQEEEGTLPPPVSVDVSDDGRYYVFTGRFSPDDPEDEALQQIYLYDQNTNSLRLISWDERFDRPGWNDSWSPRISGNGRFIVFVTDASNLTDNFDSNISDAIVLHDRDTDEDGNFDEEEDRTPLQQISPYHYSMGNEYTDPSISDDGSKIVFRSVPQEEILGHVFLYDREIDEEEEPSEGALSALELPIYSHEVEISGNGQYVVLTTTEYMVKEDTDYHGDVYVVALENMEAELVTVTPEEDPEAASAKEPSISDDGRYVSFSYSEDNEQTKRFGVHVYDRTTKTSRIIAYSGVGHSVQSRMSGDGSTVVYQSYPENAQGVAAQVFAYDLASGEVQTVSLSANSEYGNEGASEPVISADGTIAAYVSSSSNLVTGDTNYAEDIFLIELAPDSGEADTVKPVWPEGTKLSISEISHNSVKLSWPQATDNIGIISYQIYKDDEPIDSVTSSELQATIGGLQAETAYTFSVAAVDAAGNHSAPIGAEAVTGEAPVQTDIRIIEAKVSAPVKYKSFLNYNDELTITMKGDPDLTATALVEYIKTDGTLGESVVPLSEISPSNYKGSFILKQEDGVAEITRVETRLQDDSRSEALDAQLRSRIMVGGTVSFTIGDPSLLERLNGGYITMTSSGTGVSASVKIAGAGPYVVHGLHASTVGIEYAIKVTTAKGELLTLNEQTPVRLFLGRTTERAITGTLKAVVKARLVSDDGVRSSANLTVQSGGYVIYSGQVTVNDPEGYYYFHNLKVSDELKIRIYPRVEGLKDTIITLEVDSGGVNEIDLEVLTREKVTLRGQVTTDTGVPVEGAVVAAIQYLPERTFRQENQTDADGKYALEVYEGAAYVNARYAGSSYTPTKHIQLGVGEENEQNLAFTDPLPGIVQLDIYTKHAGGEWSGPLDLDWRVLVHFRFSSSHPRRDSNPGNQLAIYSLPGDTVRMCVSGVESGLPDACGEAVMDSLNKGKIELKLEQTGAKVQGQLEHDGSRKSYSIGLFEVLPDGKERHVLQRQFGPEFAFDVTKPGVYRMTVTSSGGYIASRHFEVTQGEVQNLGVVHLVGTGVYGGRPGNELTLSPTELMPGDLLQVRIKYTNSGNTVTTGTQLHLPVPAGTTLAEKSITKDGQPAAAQSGDGASHTVSLGDVAARTGGIVTYHLRLDEDYREPFVSVSPSLSYTLNGTEKTEPFGQTAASVTRIKLETPEVTGYKTLPVRGLAPAGSMVTIYDGDRKLAIAFASAAGTWQTTVPLTDGDEHFSTHLLRAEAELGSERWISEETRVTYENDYPEVATVTMSQSGERAVTFDPRQGTAVFPYVYVPGHSFAVSLAFQDSTRVSDVRVVLGNSEASMSRSGNESYHAVVTPSSPGAIYVKYKVSKNNILSYLPETTEQYKGQIPGALQDVEWTKEQVNQSQEQPHELSASYGGTVQVKGKDVEIGANLSFQEVDYTETDYDLSYASSTGISLYGFSMDYSITGQGISYSVSGYIPEDIYRNLGAEGALNQLFAAMNVPPDPRKQEKGIVKTARVVKAIKATYNGILKYKDEIWDTYEFYDDVSDTLDNTDKLKQLERILDLVAEKCDPSAANQYRDWANKIANKYMAQEVVKWAMMIGGAAAAPATFGVGTVLLFAASEFIEAVMDRAIELQIEELKDAISKDDRCEEEPEEKTKKVADPKWIYDPSGYVYEVEPSSRIEGVTATALYWDEEEQIWTVWDAEWYGQMNPLTTNHEGKYAWDVPEGKWKVVYEKEGYVTAQSEELTVLPPHTDVNIAMDSLLEPALEYAMAGAEKQYIDLFFNRHVDAATLTEEMVAVTGETMEEGEAVSVDLAITGIEALGAIEYNGRTVSKRFRLATEQLNNVTAAELQIFQGVQSYNGIPMSEDAAMDVLMQDLAPREVTNIEKIETSNGIVLQWTDPADADLRELAVSWKRSGENAYSDPVIVAKGVQSAIIGSLLPAASYELKIESVDAGGNRTGTTITADTKPEAQLQDLAAPQSVENATIQAGTAALALTWDETDYAGDLEHVLVQWKKTGDEAWVGEAEVRKSLGKYSITGLSSSTAYEVVLTALDTAGNKSAGVLLSAVTGSASEPGPVGPPVIPLDPGIGNGQERHKITEQGGEIQAFNGGMKLRIPPNAFEADAELTLSDLGDADIAGGSKWKVYSNAYQVEEQSGLQLKSPVRLTLKLDALPEGTDAEKLGIYQEDPKRKGHWLYIGGKVDADKGEIGADLSEDGIYAVLLYEHTFSDLGAHWSRKQVEVLVSRHIVNGVNEKQFLPDRPVTRAEIAKLIAELLSKHPGLPKDETADQFSDVPAGAWYSDYVSSASNWGIVKGDQGRFRPNDPVTREELTVMLMRALVLLGQTGQANDAVFEPFEDEGSVSSWARGSFASAIEAGLIEGLTEQRLGPQETATRAQAAVMIYRMLAIMDWL